MKKRIFAVLLMIVIMLCMPETIFAAESNHYSNY